MKKSAILISTALLISACSDNSASVGAGNDASTGVKTGSNLEKSKSISAQEAGEIAITMPAATLISESIASKYVIGAGKMQRIKDTNDGPFSTENYEAAFREMLSSFEKNPQMLEASKGNFDKEMLGLIHKKDLEGMTATAKRRVFERRIMACNEPLNGWETSPADDKNRSLAVSYMKTIVNQCDFTNLVFTEIASKLTGKILDNPEKAKEKILDEWGKIGIDSLEATWKNVVMANDSGQYGANLTGVKGVQFVGPGGSYVNEGGGFYVTRSGATWYGKGALSGKVVELSLRSSLATKVEKSKSITTESGTSLDGKTGTTVNVK